MVKKQNLRPFNELLNEHGIKFLSENLILSEDFIEEHADIIDDKIWISLIKNQEHIEAIFYYKFSNDMSFGVKVVLMRKRVSDLLKKISI